MKNLAKLTALSLGAVFVSTAAQAQSTPPAGDLVLGFTSQAGGVTSDYVVDLGAIPGTQNTAMSLNGYSSATFDSTFGSALDNGSVNAGIVGGFDSSTGYIYTSVLDNGTGTPTVAGSTAPNAASKSFVNAAAGTLGNLMTGAVPYASGFTANVAQSPTTPGTAANSFTGYTGDNPLTTISAGSVLLDIYQDQTPLHGTGSTVTYVGDVLLNITDSGLTATFDPTPAPEPSTYALLGAAGLLGFAFRRQLIRKNA